MQFKRWRLVATSPVVNAGLGLALLFTAVGCSKKADTPEEAPKTPEIATGVELPAVWATRPLEGKVASIALSGGMGGLLAVAYERGGLQLINMQGEIVGEPANFRLTSLGGGHNVTINGSSVTIFPGITREGELKAYIYGDGLLAPAQVDMPIPDNHSIAGVCTGEMRTGGLMRLAYWTSTNDRVLQTGIIKEENGEFTWDSGESTFTDFPIKSCVYTSDTLVASPRAISAASLNRGDLDALLSIEEGSGLRVSTDLGMTNTDVDIRDGITVVAPDKPDALAAKGVMMAGGYPGGVIVLAGETEPGEYQAVFIDPSQLTLAGSR
ncbi:hypothetical protein HY29_13900 [Hyphomonas beringensis]|uniref:BPP domain-containing protein n=1 Tax=Hyphomonas beringensis TaxID=1280946 RepID=A0A062U8P5_9PROT|nr:hypothetical protein [Hyphomonas beringensis]KCZ54642.1 hypothetical protein HY29_13900 [Hyphomonas beringensis]